MYVHDATAEAQRRAEVEYDLLPKRLSAPDTIYI